MIRANIEPGSSSASSESMLRVVAMFSTHKSLFHCYHVMTLQVHDFFSFCFCFCLFVCLFVFSRCLSGHNSQETLDRHQEYCKSIGEPANVVMPKDPNLTFTDHQKMLATPYIIYADTEALIVPLQIPAGENTVRDSIHEVMGVFGLV